MTSCLSIFVRMRCVLTSDRQGDNRWMVVVMTVVMVVFTKA